MLLVLQPGSTPADLEAVLARARKLGLTAQPAQAGDRRIVALSGGSTDATAFSDLSCVARVQRVDDAFRLSARDKQPRGTVLDIGGVRLGSGQPLCVIAGPCSLESPEQALGIARTLKQAGVRILRGGLFKPRTSPYSFQGIQEEGLKLLDEIRATVGLKVVTEAVDERTLDLLEPHADMLQIGARNMQNFSLLRRAGKCRLPVLLKRGAGATLDELLTAADYILAGGNTQVALCERGIRTFSSHSRYTLDLAAVPALHELSHLPVVVDPSHGAGVRSRVPAMALAAVAAGADAVMVEVHPEPTVAKSDGQQSLYPAQFAELLPRLQAVARAAGREA